MVCPECYKDRREVDFRHGHSIFNEICKICAKRQWKRRLKEAQIANDYAGKEAGKRERRRIRKDELAKYHAYRRAFKISATPNWISKSSFKEIYRKARQVSRETGIEHQVDHIIPLNHRLVCGLHVPWNLQVLTRAENARKHNHFVPG